MTIFKDQLPQATGHRPLAAWGGATGEPWAGHGAAFQSGPLNYHLPYTTATATATGHRPLATGCLPLPEATGCLLFNPHSRRRAERGGGSAAPPGTSVLNSGIRSVQSLCPKSLSKVSAQSLCPKSLSTPSKSSPGRALSASAAHLGP